MNFNENVGYAIQQNIGMGYNCKSIGQNSVSAGYMACAIEDNSLAVGAFVSSIHKNAVVLGNDLVSKRENSTLFNQAEFTEDGLLMNNGTSVISTFDGKLYSCTSCQEPIFHGVKWIKNGFIDEENSVELGLCFDCMLECVLEFKARMSWKNINHSAPSSETISNIAI